MSNHFQFNKEFNNNASFINYIYRMLTASIFLTTFITLFFLFSVSQRGYDIADEGFHLLASQFPLEVKAWTNVAHFYTGLMFNAVGKNIVFLRMLSEALIFISATWFSMGLIRLVSTINIFELYMNQFKIMTWSMMCLGGLFYYIHFDTTPSYNTVNAMMLYMASGFVCFSLAPSHFNNKKNFNLKMINALFAGLCLGITLLVKFPTAFTLFGLFFVLFIIWPGLSKVSRFAHISMLMLGMFLGILCHIAFLEPWQHLWRTFNDGLHTFLSFGRHTPSSCVIRYIGEICDIFVNAIHYFWKIYLLLVLPLVFRKSRYHFLNNGIFFIILLIIAGLYSFHIHFDQGGTIHSIQLVTLYFAWIMLMILSCIMGYIQKKSEMLHSQNYAMLRLFILAAFLWLLPFAGAIGTANIITLNLTQYMAAWFGLMIILLLMLAHFYEQKWIFMTGTVLISVFASSQIISSGYIAPYNLNTTIDKQTVATGIGFPRTFLKLDHASSHFFNQLNLIAYRHGFKPGDDILAFCDMPGIVFALGGKSPIVPWYLTLANAKITNLWFLQQAPLERIKKAFILENEKGAALGMPDLAQLGIKFPSDYELCGEVIWPLTGEWVRLWKAKSFKDSIAG